MLTKIDLCSMALIKLGEVPIQSWADSSPTAQLARTLFDPIISTLIASHPWRFAYKTFDLIKTGNSDFQIPADVLRIIKCNGEIVGDKIKSTSDTLSIDAVVRTPVEFFPSYFVSLAATKLAMEFCIPLVGDQNIFRMLVALYESELRSAKFIDSTTSQSKQIKDFSLISSRF